MLDIVDKIEQEEGFRESKYLCSRRHPTIGIGTKLPLTEEELKALSDARGYLVTNERLLHGFKITVDEARLLLRLRLHPLLEDLNDFKWFRKTPPNTKIALIDMGYQLGFSGLFKFKKTIQHIEDKNFGLAADEALDSRWARQTPNRAKRNAKLIKMV